MPSTRIRTRGHELKSLFRLQIEGWGFGEFDHTGLSSLPDDSMPVTYHGMAWHGKNSEIKFTLINKTYPYNGIAIHTDDSEKTTNHGCEMVNFEEKSTKEKQPWFSFVITFMRLPLFFDNVRHYTRKKKKA